ncbi:M3 family metallopeptidase [Nocardioides mangrovicus]|uniref:M3 family metallopeptidase n=1 Tax=Nocardioides mangrovicus TaxID=2478913 RepID=UPI001E4AD472|nr:M3 family metallopeptidase [Nocardioides mangrovicus]
MTDWLEERGTERLKAAGDLVAALRDAPLGDPTALELWNDVSLALADASSVASLLAAVHPDPDVVARAERIEIETSGFATDLHLDREVFDRLSALDPDALDDGGRRVLTDALRTFRRSGVDRDEETREQVRELDQQLTELGQRFSRVIREGRRTTRVTAEALAGLPADFVEAHPADADGYVEISTDYPDTHPFLAYAHDRDARLAVARTFYDLGHPDNDEVLRELLDLRHRRARLLDYEDWPSFDAEVKMIGSGPAIAEFVDRISDAAADAGRRDLGVLLERAAQDGVEEIDLASSRYYLEAVKREHHGVDAQQVRRYFAFDRVHDGLLAVTARLFGVTYERVEAPVWHEDVTSFDVLLDGEPLGRIHLDLHPRASKYNHAAQFTLVPGVRGRQLPEGVLVCNFPRGLMEHRDVVTLFHEFGHLMHHTLAGRQDWVRFSGVSTEWDFVEAPSQMLEEWAWDADVLRTFATDAEGEPIPADLVARMREAEEFGKAFLVRTQMFYAALSYYFHLERPADLAARMLELYDAYSLVRPLPDTHFYAGFGHLEGYSSGYYTYMWSLVIAKDLFSAFDPAALFAPEVATRYRDAVLAPGGSADAADLVADFLGRPYDTRAFEAWLGR